MTEFLPCPYAAMLMGVTGVIAATMGFWLGRKREQLALLEMFRPDH